MIIEEVKYNSEEYFSLCKLRDQELRIPLGLNLSDEDLSSEINQYHFGIFANDLAIACVVLSPVNNKNIKMRQVCTSQAHQGQGLGKLILKYTEKWAMQNDYSIVQCHARESAAWFYLKYGYTIKGEVFNELGIPHYFMFKELT